MMRRLRYCLFLMFAMMAGLAGLSGCGESNESDGKAKKPPLVKVQPARLAEISERLENTGEVVATNAVTVRATMEGPIGYCPWREGDRIEKPGQKLVEINRPLYREEVKAAEASLAVAKAKLADLKAGARPEEIAQAKESVKQLDECTGFAKADLERIQSLVKSGSLPGEAVEKARVTYIKCQTQLVAAKERLGMLEIGPTKTEIAVQEAMVKEAAAKRAVSKAKLDECMMPAPFAGVVTAVYVRPGDMAVVKAPLLDMMDTSSLVVRFALPESRSSTIRQGAEATIILDALPGRKFGAKVVRVYPELDRNTRTRTVEAKVTEPAGLVPGMFARVSVAARTVKEAVIVPDAAILTLPDRTKVAFVVADGKASMRTVKAGIEQGQRVQIVEGIRPGELVVVAGNQNLKDGAQVQLSKAAPTATTKRATGGDGQ